MKAPIFVAALLLATTTQAGFLYRQDELRPWQEEAESRELTLDRYGVDMRFPEPLECFQISSPILTSEGLAIDGQVVEEQGPVMAESMYLVKHSFGNSYGQPYVGTFPHFSFPRTRKLLTRNYQGLTSRLTTHLTGST